MSNVASFPLPYHLRTVRQFIEKERTKRVQTLRGDLRRAGLQDADQALESLAVIEKATKEGTTP